MNLSLVSLALFNLELYFNDSLLEINRQFRRWTDTFGRLGLNCILTGSFQELMRELSETLGKATSTKHATRLGIWFRFTHVFLVEDLLCWHAHKCIASLIFQVLFLVHLVYDWGSLVLLRGLLLSALEAKPLIVTPKWIVHTLYDLWFIYMKKF